MVADLSRRRKLEVFIGSTFRDHKEEREELINAIYSAGHIPSGMELWDADSRPLEETLQLKLEQCDVHVLLVGSTYGSLIAKGSELRDEIGYDKNAPLSYTHWEYLKSEKDSRPIIAFVLEHKSEEKSSKRAKKLKKFKRSVTQSRFCKNYTLGPISNKPKDKVKAKNGRKANSLELSKNVISALYEISSNSKLAPESMGWIRADSDEANLLREIRGNRFLKRIMDRLRQFDVLTERVLTFPNEKAMAAEVFWRTLKGPINRAGRRKLFFESGSTIAFVSEEFEHYVLSKRTVGPEWKAWTNNVESLLQLELHTDVEVVAFPSDSPDPKDKYGAMFDKTFFEVDEPAPKKSRSLYRKKDYLSQKPKKKRLPQLSERSVVERTRNDLRTAISKDEGGIVCVTASGLAFGLNGKRDKWQNGPHIGSHANMLFKRAAYTTGEPTVIFLHEDKIGENFQLGKCFPVFLADYSWDKFRKERPVALCVGYTVPSGKSTAGSSKLDDNILKKKRSIKKLLKRLGFDSMLANKTKKLTSDKDYVVGAALFANEKFVKELKLSK